MATTVSQTAVSEANASLEQRLADPQVNAALHRLLDRLGTVSFAVEAAEGFIARGDTIADSLAEAVGEFKSHTTENTATWIRQAPEMLETSRRLMGTAKAIDTEELARSEMLQRLTQPETLSLLNQLLDRLPLIAIMLDSLEGFVRRGDTIVENVAEMVHDLKLKDQKFDFAQFSSALQSLPKLQQAGEQFLNSGLAGDAFHKVIDAGVGMVDSGMMDRDVVATLGFLGKASAETYREVAANPVKPVGGMFGLWNATRDADVQKSMGFFFAFAKSFAKHLK